MENPVQAEQKILDKEVILLAGKSSVGWKKSVVVLEKGGVQ